MSISKSQSKAVAKYVKDHYKRTVINFKPEEYKLLLTLAQQEGMTLPKFIQNKIMEWANNEIQTQDLKSKDNKPRKKNPKELDFPESDEPYQPQGYLEQWAEVQKELKKKREQDQINNEDDEDEKPRKVNFDF